MAGGEGSQSKNEAIPESRRRSNDAGGSGQASGRVAGTIVQGGGTLNLILQGDSKMTVVSDRPGDVVTDFLVEDNGNAGITLQDRAEVTVRGKTSNAADAGQASNANYYTETDGPANLSSTSEAPNITVTIRIREKRETFRVNVSPVGRLCSLRAKVLVKFPNLDFSFYDSAHKKLDESLMLYEVGVKNNDTLIATKEVAAAKCAAPVQQSSRS